MSLTTRVLLGLAAGLAAGAAVSASGSTTLLGLTEAVEPVGALWLNALRMTIVPLVVSLLITGVASASGLAATGRTGARALALFALLLSASAILTALVAPGLVAAIPIDAGTAAGLRAGVEGAGAVEVPPFATWITGIIPVNPIRAAADGAMLPLVVFAILFGFAATRIEGELRESLLRFFRAVAETMLVLVRWVLWAAPVGVFALVLPLGARAGLGTAGALAYYVVLLSGLSMAAVVLVYPVAVVFGRVPLLSFARAAAPAQVVAFSTQSSLASLPAMIDGAQVRLGLPPRVTGVILPLAVSVFRITSPIRTLTMALFGAALFGVEIAPVQLAAGAAVAVLASVGAVGLPGQISLLGVAVPVFAAMGAPLAALPIVIAVDTIPDLFGTVGNVTADLAATTVIARGDDPLGTVPELESAPQAQPGPPVERPGLPLA